MKAQFSFGFRYLIIHRPQLAKPAASSPMASEDPKKPNPGAAIEKCTLLSAQAGLLGGHKLLPFNTSVVDAAVIGE